MPLQKHRLYPVRQGCPVSAPLIVNSGSVQAFLETGPEPLRAD